MAVYFNLVSCTQHLEDFYELVASKSSFKKLCTRGNDERTS